MANDNLNKAYELLMKRREANVARNMAEGRSMNMQGTPLESIPSNAAESLGGLRDKMINSNSAVQNLSDVVKTTPNDMLGIDPKLAYKSKFPSTTKALQAADDVVPDNKGILGSLKNSKGIAKMLPMLGLGGLGLAGLSIAGKVQAGEYGGAGLDAADLGTDYVPVVGQVKSALRPTELGNAELPDEMMRERELYNAARRAKSGEVVNNPSDEQPLIAPEGRAKKEELDAIFEKIRNRQ